MQGILRIDATMDAQTLITALQDKDPVKRLKAARVIGMLDEVDTLEALMAALRQETDAELRDVMLWAQHRLKQASDARYNTFTQIWHQYHLERELDQDKSLLDSYREYLEDQADEAILRGPGEPIKGSFGNIVLLGLSVLSGPVLLSRGSVILASGAVNAVSGMFNSSLTQLDSALSSSFVTREGAKDSRKRLMPQQPTQAPIQSAVKRLMQTDDPGRRAQAAVELATLNNLLALIPLALVFHTDSNPYVRESAQIAGKRLYWNGVYWTMEQDGRLTAQIEKVAAELRLTIKRKSPEDEEARAEKARLDAEKLLQKGFERRRWKS